MKRNRITKELLKAMEDSIGYPCTASIYISDSRFLIDIEAYAFGKKLISTIEIPLYESIPCDEYARIAVRNMQNSIMHESFSILKGDDTGFNKNYKEKN